jgi:3-oxocholest-4-en-26-oyl-CoA dehydrogenase alpha subunit
LLLDRDSLMTLAPTELTKAERELQREIREFLDVRLPPGSYEPSLGMPGISDPAFSRDLGARGFLGMAISKKYGGGGRTAVERLIVVEALLARGAPVGYHWFADRQTGPSIERYGSEAQKQWYLPAIARGELSFAIGMSEPDAGSDLASLRGKAQDVDGGWVINGTKIWTSGAAEATHILGLFRTSENRHAGLTQFVIDCNTPGVAISPIPFIDGSRDFCEVAFRDVFIGDNHRLGPVGDGWKQNTGELVLERGGVDRWMSMFPILEGWAPTATTLGESALADLGLLTARLWGLRRMSLALARLVDAGQSPTGEAAMVKEMATRFEQDCVEMVCRHRGNAPDLISEDQWESLLARAILVSPSWSIRGGTSEILRTIIAKGLGS